VPDVRGREEILKVHTKKTPLSAEIKLSVIARGTPGFTGADLENLVNESALIAAREDKKYIEMVDLEFAKDKVLMGSERKSMILSEDERRTTAIHESGHTLVGKFLSGTDPIHKVTIIPRGMALGLTQTLPKEDTHNLDKSKAEQTISFMMGGRVAEELILKQKTTGAGNDFERATDLARKMVCEWGMSDKIGPLSFGKKPESIFLGREIAQHRDYSEQTAQIIDREVREIVGKSYKVAHDILSKNIKLLQKLADALLEYETLDGEDVDRIVKGLKIVRKPESEKSPESPKVSDDKPDNEKKKKKGSEGGPAAAPLPA